MLTRDECRRADEKAIQGFHIPGVVLMENAGRNCAEKLMLDDQRALGLDHAVLVLCGPGNNGGDGFVIARHLYILGVRVKVVLFRRAEAYTGDARTMLMALSRLRIPVVEFDPSWPSEKILEVFSSVQRIKTTWVVDALLGTGATGEPREPMVRAIQTANALDVRRFAVDIPTGLDCDTGFAAATTFRADLTCSMIDRKAGFTTRGAEAFTGRAWVVGIGAPHEITM